MPRINVLFRNRDHSTRLIEPAIEYEVERYSYNVIGGPEQARITARGSFLELWNLVRYLRSPTEIYDESGEALWWGYVKEVRLSNDLYELRLTLDRMANHVRVSYTERTPGTGTAGTQRLSTAATDQESIDEFGTKEMIEPLSNTDQTTAEGLRDLILSRRKFPIPIVEIREARELSAEIFCNGWWDTLGWRYYVEEGSAELNSSQDGSHAFGTNDTEFIAQSFDVTQSQGWRLNLATAMLAKSGSPTDDVVTGIYTDMASAPGTLIQSGTIANANLSDFLTWPLHATLSEVAGLNLTAGGTYWLRLSRTGSLDDTNYFLVGTDSGLNYADGSALRWNGSAWVALDTDADLAFDVSGVRETNTQIDKLLEDKGQFFTSREVVETNIDMPARTQGNFTALERVLELIECGTSAGRRLSVEVTPGRIVKVAEEPLSGADNLLLSGDGSMHNRYDIEIPQHHIHKIVRRWVTPKTLATIVGNVTRFADFGNLFVEQVEYDVRRERFRIRTRETPDLFKIARMEGI